MKWLSVICALAFAGPGFAQSTGGIIFTPAPLTITTESPLPNATTGVSYSQQFTSTGGVGTVTWSASGSLPPGLSLGSSGVIGGTPTQSGTFGFLAKATDARQNMASQS